MQRPIKFRAWNPYDKKMYRPTSDEGVLTDPSYELALWDGGWEICIITADGKSIVVASETRTGQSGGVLMQFTGLYDRNGVEIYEGDILRHHMRRISDNEPIHHDSVVEWQSSVGYDGPGIGYQLNPEEMNQTEVVGNIYESQGLLDAKAN